MSLFKQTIQPISAHDYVTKYLAWQINGVSSSNINYSPIVAYESYAAMINPMLEMEANNGSAGAILELGERHLYGIDGYEKNAKKAEEYFLKAAELGHPDGYYMLTRLYQNDEFGMKDMKLYFKYLESGAQRGGSCILSYNIFCAYMKGKEAYDGVGFDRDVKKAYKYLQVAESLARELFICSRKMRFTTNFKNNVNTWYNLFLNCNLIISNMIEEGEVGKADVKKAIKQLEEANKLHFELLDRTYPEFEEKIEYLKSSL